MTTERDVEIEDIERFYARQRTEILARVAAAGSGRRGARARRGSWTAALAAAAMLAGAALALALLPVSAPPGAGAGLEAPSLDRTLLPLPAFAAWSEAEMLDGTGPAFGSVDWLMDGEATSAIDDSLPQFLIPFGSWPQGTESKATSA